MRAQVETDLPLDNAVDEQAQTVSIANAAIRSGFSSHTGADAPRGS